jgi:hypothetical protein
MKKRLNDAGELRRVVEQLHNCKASFRTSLEVHEVFQGKTVWDGSVLVFDVDHPDASIGYAWTALIGDTDRRRSYVILGKPPVNSPADAVRAAIVADNKSGRLA